VPLTQSRHDGEPVPVADAEVDPGAEELGDGDGELLFDGLGDGVGDFDVGAGRGDG
jgi:hypothetical protein